MSKRAILLAGGLGTRLRPYTIVLPKPLMPIGEFPILEVIIRQLVNHQFEHITLAVNHQAHIIKAFFQDGSKWGIKIDYSIEERVLGTMGPLKLINDLPENFLVMNGDILTDLDYSEFYNYHINKKANFTISSKSRNSKIDYGVLETNKNNQLINFKEKPSLDFEVSMGVYMINKKILELVPKNFQYGFDDLMKEMLKRKFPVEVKLFKGYWLDIGRPDDYNLAIDDFEKIRGQFLND